MSSWESARFSRTLLHGERERTFRARGFVPDKYSYELLRFNLQISSLIDAFVCKKDHVARTNVFNL